MRTLTFDEIKKLDAGEIIPSFEATIKKAFDQKTGTGQYGQWWMQNIILAQGDSELTGTWCGEDKMGGESIGKTFRFESSDTKHGKQGLKWEVTKKGDKTYEQIRITAVAKIAPLNSSSTTPAPEARKTTAIEYDEDAAVRDARAFAMRMANALLIALEASRYVASEFEKKHLGEEIAPEQQQAMTSSIFISMNREGVGNQLPAHPLKPLVRESVLPKKEEKHESEVEW